MSNFQNYLIETQTQQIKEYQEMLADQRKRYEKLLDEHLKLRSEHSKIQTTRSVIDEHSLWGNAIEIVKCLRDGLDPLKDAEYKDLCLGIILDHFKYIDEHLDLLPKDSCPTYKELLHELKTEDSDSESESSEESESEAESEDSDSDPLWNEIPDYAWDYNNPDWISQIYKIKDNKKLSVSERVERITELIASFEEEIASRQVAEEDE